MKFNFKLKVKFLEYGCVDTSVASISNDLVADTSADEIINGLVKVSQTEKNPPWLDLIKTSKKNTLIEYSTTAIVLPSGVFSDNLT